MIKKYMVLAIMVWTSVACITAQVTEKQDTVRMHEIVISSNRQQTVKQYAPSLVEVISGETMQLTNAVCLAQGLGFSTGVRVEDNCQNCGFTQVRINGLDGHYSQILIDSRPVFSSLMGVYGLEQIPAEMIERVEIVRGGGSALFGASAVGGTINIITREAERNSASVSHTLTSIGGTRSLDNATGFNAAVLGRNRRAGVNVFGQHRHRDAYDHNADGYSDIPKLNNLALGMNAYWRPSLNSKLTVSYNTIHDEHRGGNRLNLQPHESNISEGAKHHIHSGQLAYHGHFGQHCVEGYVALQNTLRESYYGGCGEETSEDLENALKAYGYTYGFTALAGARYTYSFRKLWFLPAEMTVGAEYNYDYLNDSVPGFGNYMEQKIHIYSGYVQNEWKNNQWAVLVGARLDKHSLIRPPVVSPRVNVRFNPMPALSLRVGYAAGFRAPQTYDEDLHVAMAEGVRIVNTLADDLREERSHSATLSADYILRKGSLTCDFLMEGFYTFLNHIFATRYITDEEDITWVERYNADKGSVYGAHAEVSLKWKKWMSATLGLTWQRGSFSEPVQWNEDAPMEQRMLRTPNLYGQFVLESVPWRTLSLSLSGNLTGPMLVPHETEKPVLETSPTFFTLNARVAYDFHIHNKSFVPSEEDDHTCVLQLNGGVMNITNSYQQDLEVGLNRDSGYIYGPLLPRCFFIGLKLSI